jgi:four helix bundle protein
MPYKTRSPKSEVRSPKEDDCKTPQTGAFWAWGDDSSRVMVLQETGPAKDEESYDLEERVTLFGVKIIRFAKKIPKGPVTNRLIDQLVGAGTSIGANYCEAKDAVSRRDFMNKVGISRKESKETMFFLRLIAATEESMVDEARQLWCEARELNRIFGSIWRKA